MLQDLLFGFESPSVMDCKMGVRSVSNDMTYSTYLLLILQHFIIFFVSISCYLFLSTRYWELQQIILFCYY